MPSGTTPKSPSEHWESVVGSLVSIRKEQGITQEVLADKIGCASSLVHKWECYKRFPSGFLLICWAEALGAQIQIRQDRQEQQM